VFGYSKAWPFEILRLVRLSGADIFHSSEPSLATVLAMMSAPGKKHLVTVRDPRDLEDWKIEYAQPSLSKWQVALNYIFENNPLVKSSVRRADGVFAPAKCLIGKITAMYRLSTEPVFLPTPVKIPPLIAKSDRPKVCYAGRIDRRKRPELFLDLASQFPHVEFIVMGKSRDVRYEQDLRQRYEGHANVSFLGFVNQFESSLHTKVLSSSWVMVNTSLREGLPNAFIESAAHGCAIVSSVNPDGFSALFGMYVTDDDFASALALILENDIWKTRGEAGRDYVSKTFATAKSIDSHEAIYAKCLLG
jgi:glycosyltransferase involved in cell wall biosynthesis